MGISGAVPHSVVPELEIQFRLEDSGSFQFKFPFHLIRYLRSWAKKTLKGFFEGFLILGTALLLPSCMPATVHDDLCPWESSAELPGLPRCKLSPPVTHSSLRQCWVVRK